MKQSTLTNGINSVSILLMIAIVSIFVCIMYFNQLSNDAHEARFDLTLNANRFMNGSAYLTSEVRNYATTADETNYNNYWNEINTLKNRDIGVETLKKIGITPEEQSMIEAMSDLSNNLVPLESAAMDKVKAGDAQSAIADVFGKEYERTIGKIGALKSEFLVKLDKRAHTQVAELEEKVFVLGVILLVLTMLLIVLQSCNIYIIKSKVIRPVIAIKDEMCEFSKGNLHSAFALTPDTSEIGLLIDAIHTSKQTLSGYIDEIANTTHEMSVGNFRSMPSTHFAGDFQSIEQSIIQLGQEISGTLSKIKSGSTEISNEANQMAHTAQALAHGASEQAISVDDLSGSIRDIAMQVKKNADSAQLAHSAADSVTEDINKSNQQMAQMVDAMSEISQSSYEIGKIIKTIEDIAFQTNILALNASVEAARAGAAGKGFVVVADEVRNLANKSSEAAKQTNVMIEHSMQSVENGVRIAEVTANALQGVVEGSAKIAVLITQISDASAAQADSVSQINSAVSGITAVVQTNAATSEQSAAASEELLRQVIVTDDLISKFALCD